MKKWVKMLIIGIVFIIIGLFTFAQPSGSSGLILIGIGVILIIIALIVGFSRLMGGMLAED